MTTQPSPQNYLLASLLNIHITEDKHENSAILLARQGILIDSQVGSTHGSQIMSQAKKYYLMTKAIGIIRNTFKHWEFNYISSSEKSIKNTKNVITRQLKILKLFSDAIKNLEASQSTSLANCRDTSIINQYMVKLEPIDEMTLTQQLSELLLSDHDIIKKRFVELKLKLLNFRSIDDAKSHLVKCRDEHLFFHINLILNDSYYYLNYYKEKFTLLKLDHSLLKKGLAIDVEDKGGTPLPLDEFCQCLETIYSMSSDDPFNSSSSSSSFFELSKKLGSFPPPETESSDDPFTSSNSSSSFYEIYKKLGSFPPPETDSKRPYFKPKKSANN